MFRADSTSPLTTKGEPNRFGIDAIRSVFACDERAAGSDARGRDAGATAPVTLHHKLSNKEVHRLSHHTLRGKAVHIRAETDAIRREASAELKKERKRSD